MPLRATTFVEALHRTRSGGIIIKNGVYELPAAAVASIWLGRLSPRCGRPVWSGEKLPVGFAGCTAEVVDGHTREIILDTDFRRCTGRLEFHYAEAASRQKLPDCIAAGPYLCLFSDVLGAAEKPLEAHLRD